VLGLTATLALTCLASAAEVHVMISRGLTAAYKALVPEFERSTGHNASAAPFTDRLDLFLALKL
jgi:molybdate transport system substrate-binding protein